MQSFVCIYIYITVKFKGFLGGGDSSVVRAPDS